MNFASSDILSGVHGGSHVSSVSTSSIPGMLRMPRCMCPHGLVMRLRLAADAEPAGGGDGAARELATARRAGCPPVEDRGDHRVGVGLEELAPLARKDVSTRGG